MPYVFEGSQVLEWVCEIGLYVSGMNGPQPIDHKEIEAWSNLTGRKPTAEEVKLMRTMSSDFCSYYHSKDDEQEPYERELTEAEMLAYQKAQRAKRKSMRGK